MATNQDDQTTQLTQEEVDSLSFKDASVKLEQIIRALESGELELESSLVHYANGVLLLDSLHKRLAEAEQKVSILDDATSSDAVVDTQAAPSTAFINE